MDELHPKNMYIPVINYYNSQPKTAEQKKNFLPVIYFVFISIMEQPTHDSLSGFVLNKIIIFLKYF